MTLLRLKATPVPGYGNTVPRLRELFIATPIQICVCAIERVLACGGSAALLFPMAVLVTIDSLRVWESRVSLRTMLAYGSRKGATTHLYLRAAGKVIHRCVAIM